MDLKRNIEDFDLVFFDLETTGLDAVKGDAICEIGAVKIKNREVIDKFQTLINPKINIPAEASRIHRISDEDVKESPYFENIADKFISFLGNSILFAYNIEFDLGFINHELKRIEKPSLEIPAIDVLNMARKTLRLSRYNLSSIASFLNIEYLGQMHRALDDALVTYKVFFKLRDILGQGRLNNLEDFLSLYGFGNAIYRKKEEPKVSIVTKAITDKSFLRARYFSQKNIMEEGYIKPINLSQENNSFFLWYEDKTGKNIRMNLNRILDVESI